MGKVGAPIGHPKSGGRVKGTQNKRTEKIKAALTQLVLNNLPKLQEEISKLEGKDYAYVMDKMMGHVIPKPIDVDVKGDIKTDATIQQKRDAELLKTIPADVLADVALQLQSAIKAAEPDKYEDDGEYSEEE